MQNNSEAIFKHPDTVIWYNKLNRVRQARYNGYFKMYMGVSKLEVTLKVAVDDKQKRNL